jgi:hypothetical protein
MRRFVVFACALALLSAPALAADGQVSKSSLERMGLGGMKVVSDQDGLQVRGTSIAIAFSEASGTIIWSVNSPVSIGSHFAFSASVGVSGNTLAGGSATASAH